MEEHVRLRTRVTVGATALAGAGLLAAALLVGPGAAASESAAAPAPAAAAAPPELTPPAGNVLSSSMGALGVQIYRCAAGAWTFVEPSASLAGRGPGPQAAIHFRGPSWQSILDGSLVEGSVVASVPKAGTIPQLLLRSKANRGTGVFGRVTFIQRLNTTGGVAPTGTCAEGQERGVRYTAEYRFFVPG
jgi:hypothetical protein